MTPEQKIQLILEGKNPKEVEASNQPAVTDPAVVPQIDPATGEVANPDFVKDPEQEEEPAVSLTNPLSVDPVDPAAVETKSVQEEAEIIEEGMKLVSKHGEGQHTAKVYKDSDYDEYRVKFFKDGKHVGEDADYHTDDQEDAKSTADAELAHMNKKLDEELTIEAIDEMLSKYGIELTEEMIAEMSMDAVQHPKYGNLTWENEAGTHYIKKNGKPVYEGTHEEVAKRWSAIKKTLEESVTESYVARHGKVSAEAVKRFAKELFPQEKTLTPDHWEVAKNTMLDNLAKHQKMRAKVANESVEELEEATAGTIPVHKLEAGQEYHMKERGRFDKVRFNGWTDDDKKYGESGGKFKTMKEIPGISKLGDIESKAAGKEHGMSHYAHFTALDKDGNDDYEFHGYVYKNKLSVGSGATPVTFHSNPIQEETVELLAADANLTEEYKAKAKELFEEEVENRVFARVAAIQEEAEAKINAFAEDLQKQKEAFISDMSEKIDVYLEEISEKWIVENRQALEAKAKVEIMESFMQGVKALYEQHNMQVPESSVDVVAEMQAKLDALQESLDAQATALQEATQTINALTQEKLIAEATEGLTKIDKTRFEKLVEEVEFVSEEEYKSRIEVIREQFFQKRDQVTNNLTEDKLNISGQQILEANDNGSKMNPRMQAYLKFLNGNK